jgi:uncharacterized membrane protein YkvA (DUF1232 family)
MSRALNFIANIKQPYTLYLVFRDPRTAGKAKAYSVIIIALLALYALSPIDIVPDAIPLLGWLDDLLLIPLAFNLMERFLPSHILADNRATASKRVNKVVLALVLTLSAVVLLWAAGLTALIFLIIHLING